MPSAHNRRLLAATAVVGRTSRSSMASPTSRIRRFGSFRGSARASCEFSEALAQVGFLPDDRREDVSDRVAPKHRHAGEHFVTIAPNAQTSARLSTFRPRACSGAMYAAVPRITLRLLTQP